MKRDERDDETLETRLMEAVVKYEETYGGADERHILCTFLRNNDCRAFLAQAVDGDALSISFVHATCRGHVDVIQAFLDHGMYIDRRTSNMYTALIMACCVNEDCILFLLNHNANVNAQDNLGWTPLMHASEGGCERNAEILLSKHANVDLQSESGMTALMIASDNNHKEVVRVLLNHGADIDMKNKEEKTALELTNDEEIKELLENHAINNNYVLK